MLIDAEDTLKTAWNNKLSSDHHPTLEKSVTEHMDVLCTGLSSEPPAGIKPLFTELKVTASIYVSSLKKQSGTEYDSSIHSEHPRIIWKGIY